tara:strand:+ start:2201 stop:3916 length:1716 start_codon:yes stop_codon:yes gene_type:complete
MGIKHFFIWYKKHFPDCIETINTDSNIQHANIDNLCLDMNGIYHTCAQKIYQYGDFKKNRPLLRKQKPKNSLRWQLEMFKETCQRINFYVKMVKPKKRLILCVDGVAGFAKMSQQRQRRFKSAKDAEESKDTCDFNATCITPGTKFMNFLSKYIDWYIRLMVSTDLEWQNIEIIFSNEKVPGEGEHKIINYIRNHGKEDDTYCIHGLDADLIMLSLGTLHKNMYILRENTYNVSEHYLLNIGMFGDKIIDKLRWEDGKQFRKTNAIDDFIFMCFLVGNDFVPTIPTIAILEDGIDIMFDVYKKVCKDFGHLTRLKNKEDPLMVFRTESLSNFLQILSQSEKQLMEDKMNSKQSYFPDDILEKNSTLGVDNHYNVNFEGYKKDYYIKKFSEDCDIESICNEYLKGLQWVITYYKKGSPDWRWFYPYYYGPFLSDLSKYCKKFKFTEFEVNTPVSPYLQLLSVIPPQCSDILPSPLDKITTDVKLRDYFPKDFDIDLSGKRREWEGIAIVPFVDIEVLTKEYEDKICQVSEQDQRLNVVGKSYIYRNVDITYCFKSFYGDIDICSVKPCVFDI